MKRVGWWLILSQSSAIFVCARFLDKASWIVHIIFDYIIFSFHGLYECNYKTRGIKRENIITTTSGVTGAGQGGSNDRNVNTICVLGLPTIRVMVCYFNFEFFGQLYKLGVITLFRFDIVFYWNHENYCSRSKGRAALARTKPSHAGRNILSFHASRIRYRNDWSHQIYQ